MLKHPEHIASYRIISTLGTGGMGIVYKGQHSKTGEEVAIKIVHIPDELSLESIRREIRALARIKHPGIANILDVGVLEGMPWYAMQIVDGKTLKKFMSQFHSSRRRLKPKPQSKSSSAAEYPVHSRRYIKTLMTITRRLCHTLSFLHGEGIVHRDLKPANIIVKSDGMPLLVDFGLITQYAGDVSRETLVVERGPVGTTKYMAPELILRKFVDARADLYSLGCILYELLTGQPPFRDESKARVLKAHLLEQPSHLSNLIKDLPDDLVSLVHNLLEKDPRKRIGYADDVAIKLQHMGAPNGLSSKFPKPRPYLYRAELAGRDGTLNRLMVYLSVLKKGKKRLILIGGESGIGKTRLVMELGRKAVVQGVQILTGECRRTSVRPLEAFKKPLKTLADRCKVRGKTLTDRIFGRRGRVLSIYEPSLLDLPELNAFPDPTELEPDEARLRLFSYLSKTLFMNVQDNDPLLLILDDLHWADDLSLGFLDFLFKGEDHEQWPLFIIGTFRTEEAGPKLQKMFDYHHVKTFILKRLEHEAIGSIVQDMLALSSLPRLLSEHLSRFSEGNPFFIAEYLRAAVEEGLFWRDENGTWHAGKANKSYEIAKYFSTLPLPVSLQDLITRRLKTLPNSAQLVLNIAAVIGQEIDFLLLREMTPFAEEFLFDYVGELLRRQLLEKAGPRSIRFVHDYIRNVAYDQIDEKARKRLHGVAARGLESLSLGNKEDYLEDLGIHWEKAGEFEKARHYYLERARIEVKQFSLVEAERLYRTYMRLSLTISREKVDIRNELGCDVLHHQGRNQDAFSEHQQAFIEAEACGYREGMAHAMHHLANIFRLSGKKEKANQLYEKAMKIYQEEGNRSQEGNMISNIAVVHSESGKYKKAKKMFEKAITIHREVGKLDDKRRTLNNLAILLRKQGKMDKAKALYEQNLEIERMLGNRQKEAGTLGNLAVLLQEQGDLEEAKKLYEKALDNHRLVGNRLGQGLVTGNLAVLFHLQGDFKRAVSFYEQALIINREVNNTVSEGQILGNLALLHCLLGNVETALEIGRKARKIYKETGDQWSEANNLGNLALFYSVNGDMEEAWSLYEKAIQLSEQLGVQFVQGSILSNMATLKRRTDENLDQAKDLAYKSMNIFKSLKASLNITQLWCELGHINLAQGRNSTKFLKRAKKGIASLHITLESELGRSLAKLSDAQLVFELGDKSTLFRGEIITNIPPGLRQWLVDSGQLRLEQSKLENAE